MFTPDTTIFSRMREKEIQKEVNGLFGNTYVLNNSYMYQWECDYFGITKSGYAYEVEIKVTKADFKADFIKGKHDIFALDCNKPILLKGRTNSERVSIKVAEHFGLEIIDINRELDSVYMHVSTDIVYDYPNVPNRFYYACPENLIDKKDIPDYAGLIYTNSGYTRVVKQAPFLHKRKFDRWKVLLNKFYYENLNMQHIANELKYNYIQLQRSYEIITEEEAAEAQIQIEF